MTSTWTGICPLDHILPGSGVCALVDGRRQIAVFRTPDGRVYALDNRDPFTGAMVLSRGLLGDLAGQPYVASPLLKQRFSLDDGACLDDPAVRLACFPARIRDGMVELLA